MLVNVQTTHILLLLMSQYNTIQLLCNLVTALNNQQNALPQVFVPCWKLDECHPLKRTVSKSTLSNNMPLWIHHKVALLYSVQKEEMRKEMRSEGSDRKWVLFVICGTRYFIKPVYVRDILYMLQGLWALRKCVHNYEETAWHDSKRHVIILFLTGAPSQTKQIRHIQTKVYTWAKVCI